MAFTYPNNYSYTGGYNFPQSNPQNYFAWVQGEAAALAFQVAPNSTVVLMDSEKPVMYMKSADSTGRPGQMVKQYLVSEEEYNSRVKTSVESLMKDKLIAFYIADKENIDISDKAYEQYIDDYLTSEDVTKETIEKETGMSFEEYCELSDMYSVFVLQTVSDKVKEWGTQKK